MSFCVGSTKAIVTYTKSNNQRIKREFTNVPIDVNILPATGGTYRFYGVGDDQLAYELIATGFVPTYTLNTGFNSRGYTPTMDGILLRNQSYYYVSGYGIEIVNPPIEKNRIQITGSGNNFIDQVAGTNGNYSVSCDDDCPEGFHKCTHKAYPGYCCIPCKETGDRLKNIASKVRG